MDEEDKMDHEIPRLIDVVVVYGKGKVKLSS